MKLRSSMPLGETPSAQPPHCKFPNRLAGTAWLTTRKVCESWGPFVGNTATLVAGTETDPYEC